MSSGGGDFLSRVNSIKRFISISNHRHRTCQWLQSFHLHHRLSLGSCRKTLLISCSIIERLLSKRSHLDAFPSSIIVLNLSSDGIFAVFSIQWASDLIDSDGASELIDANDDDDAMGRGWLCFKAAMLRTNFDLITPSSCPISFAFDDEAVELSRSCRVWVAWKWQKREKQIYRYDFSYS